MEVFISWSGTRSRRVAKALEQWLPQVLQSIEPWLSTEIKKGKRWGPAIAERLNSARVGIFCLTPENLSSPWIHFEAGAISKTPDAHACTFLVDLQPTDVEFPLADFQHTSPTREDVLRLMELLNSRVDKPLEAKILVAVFDKWWPELEASIKKASAREMDGRHGPVRTDRDLLEEILEIVRSSRRQVRQNAPWQYSYTFSVAYPSSVKSEELVGITHALERVGVRVDHHGLFGFVEELVIRIGVTTVEPFSADNLAALIVALGYPDPLRVVLEKDVLS